MGEVYRADDLKLSQPVALKFLPDHLLSDGEGNARILDFGLAGLTEEFKDEELAAGTPAYMAPEQLEGKEQTVKTDIYSLGLVLYELFTGKKAFEAATLGELIKLRRSDTTPTTPTSTSKISIR